MIARLSEAWVGGWVVVGFVLIEYLMQSRKGDAAMTESNSKGAARDLVPHIPEAEAPVQREEPFEWQGLVLDPRDTFEAAVANIVSVYRHRRPNMMIEGDIFATFTHSARSLDIPGFGTPEALLHLLQKEQANINAMRRTGKLFDPSNVDALGSYLEMAFHASLLYAWIKLYTRDNYNG
jgi:hypothetical protein